ncbi:MAG: choice-of-anchor tandem repeat GloVer-containing protein [Terriglobales bacterium]
MKSVALRAALVVLLSGMAFSQAQYKVLWNFGGSGDGIFPLSSLIFDQAGNLYGTTEGGGSSTGGTVFRLSPNQDGTWTETILYSFCQDAFCADGLYPHAGLLLDKRGNLYGTTYSGGNQPCSFLSSGCGTVFELSPSQGSSWTETVLYNFCSNDVDEDCLDGALPVSQLTADASENLYGTTSTGGPAGESTLCCVGGTVFKLSHAKSGWTETALYSFCPNGGPVCLDGAGPQAGVTFDKTGNLYGTTQAGGDPASRGAGTVYKLSAGANGWTETVLLADRYPFRNGVGPVGAISFDVAGRIYTTFSAGGKFNFGGVVKLIPAGRHELYWFNGQDGATPMAGVLVDSQNAALYGTTSVGGSAQQGTLFSITAPEQETILYNFCSQANCTDGAQPQAGLLMDKAGNLYGTTTRGGANGLGVVYEIMPQANNKTKAHAPLVRSLLEK